MVTPSRLSLPVKEDPQPWQERFGEVSVGFNEGTPPADITAEVVYANYGLAEDYQVLKERGISVEGMIVLVRSGGGQRSEKPYQAHVQGAAGLIMYNDPADDGYVRGVVYPDGPWRGPQCIERGTLYRWWWDSVVVRPRFASSGAAAGGGAVGGGGGTHAVSSDVPPARAAAPLLAGVSYGTGGPAGAGEA